MNEPLALLLLEDIDQPYTDYEMNDENDNDTTPVIGGVSGLRALLGVKETE